MFSNNVVTVAAVTSVPIKLRPHPMSDQHSNLNHDLTNKRSERSDVCPSTCRSLESSVRSWLN